MLLLTVNYLSKDTSDPRTPSMLEVTLEEPGEGDTPFAHEVFLRRLYAKILTGEDFPCIPPDLQDLGGRTTLALFRQALTYGTIVPERTVVQLDADAGWFGSYELKVILILQERQSHTPHPHPPEVPIAFALTGLPA